MIKRQTSRRDMLRATAGLLAGAAGGAIAGDARAQQAVQVKWSSGTEAPTLHAPPNATDCHFHIYDSSFPVAPYATLKPPEASVDDLLALRRRLASRAACSFSPRPMAPTAVTTLPCSRSSAAIAPAWWVW
jgi:hypothetical protein